MTDQDSSGVPPIPVPQHPVVDPPLTAPAPAVAAPVVPPVEAAPLPPRPAYGEYAPTPPPAPPVYTQPGYPQQPAYAPPAYTPPAAAQPAPALPRYPGGTRPARTGDVVATSILLVFALFGMLGAVFTALGLPSVIQSQYDDAGLGAYVPTAAMGEAQAAILISNLVLFLAAVGISVPLLVKRRLTFYVPLAAGGLAAILYWGFVFAAFIAEGKV